ncbi:hypothetical protein [Fibrisoma limi]|nr:hypothetical protein [Fibrisoma limi]
MAKQKKEIGKVTLSGPELDAQLPHDAEILRIASQYAEFEKQVDQQVNEWLSKVELRHLSGSEKSAYLKKLGHRPLTNEDLATLVLLYGSDAQKQFISAFEDAKTKLTARLAKTANLGLVLKQAGVNYNTYYNRVGKPDLWKPNEMIEIMTVLKRLKL